MMTKTMDKMIIDSKELEQVCGGVNICVIGNGMSNPFADDTKFSDDPTYCQCGVVIPIPIFDQF